MITDLTIQIPPQVSEVAETYRLKPELAVKVALTSPHVYTRNEIGGPTVVVGNIKAFVAEVRAARGKPMWKR